MGLPYSGSIPAERINFVQTGSSERMRSVISSGVLAVSSMLNAANFWRAAGQPSAQADSARSPHHPITR
jgi:hypothetical protein